MQNLFKIYSLFLLQILVFTGCITINEGPKVKPVPNFTINNNNCHAACTISFQNTTIGEEVQYQWDFGDGTTSKEVSPTHLYTQQGIYDVKLTAQNTGGVESIVKQVTIDAPALPTKCKIKSVSITAQNIFGTLWDAPGYPDIYVRALDNLGNTYMESIPRIDENGSNLPILINTFFTALYLPNPADNYLFRMYDEDGSNDQIMMEFSFTPNDYLPATGQNTSQFTLSNSDIMMVVVLEWAE